MNKDALWASGQDETVEVNQRALIDSMYSLLVKLLSKVGWAQSLQGRDLGEIFWRAYRCVHIQRAAVTFWPRPMDQAEQSVFRELLQNADDAGVCPMMLTEYILTGWSLTLAGPPCPDQVLHQTRAGSDGQCCWICERHRCDRQRTPA